jgi:hypothetical protein
MAASRSIPATARPEGNAAWLDSNGFADIDTHERTGAVYIVEHQAEIEAWQRRRANHPNMILMHYRRGSSPQRSGPRPKTRLQPHGRPVQFPQDVLKRAALAIRKDCSNDTSRMARICLGTAIRDDHDLVALMLGPYVQAQKTAQQEPVPLHA